MNEVNTATDMINKLLLLLLLTLMPWASVEAQETIFRNFPSSQYKGGTQNWDIVQLPDGRMAIANNLGLLIYDGAQWELFYVNNYSAVRSLYYEASTDRLYVGASGEFGYFQVDPFTFQYNYHSLSASLPAKVRNFGEVWKILPWQGKLVFQSKSHLFILEKNGKFLGYPSPERIETVAVAGNRLVLATRHGLRMWTGTGTRLLSGAAFDHEMIVRTLVPLDNVGTNGSSILVVTQQDGILTYDGKQLIPDLTPIAPILKSNQIFCATLHGSKLAIGTVKAGVIVRDLRGGQNSYLNGSKGLLNNTVLSTTFDKDGNLWLGLDNGLSCAMTNVPFQNIISEKLGIGMGYVSAVMGNTLYLGTNQGLFMVDLPFTQLLEYKQPSVVSGVTGQIWGLTSVDGNLYCCADLGLFRISGKQATKIENTEGVWGICELKSHPGYILAADYQGFVLLRKENESCRVVNRLETDVVSGGNFMEDVDGSIWMSHWQQGIYRLLFSKDMRSLKSVEKFGAGHELLVDQGNILCKVRGKIYISAVDGFYTYDHRKKKLVYDKPLSKVFDTYGVALKITETPRHDLWAQKQDFLAIAHPRGKGYWVDSTSYRGIAKMQQLSGGNLLSLDNGYAVVNSNDGFFLVKEHTKISGHAHPLFISKVVSTNDGDSIVYRHSLMMEQKRRSAGEPSELVLPHRLNSIVLEFVSPEYLTDDAVAYSCYLENYDKRWSLSSSNSKEYTQLGKGNYVFHVKAYNRISGKTMETEFKITILPAWYETIWAYLVYLLLGCLVLYGVVKYLKYRADRELMIERTKRKAEQVEMKNERLQNELKHKSSELASSTMSSIHQNDILQKLDEEMALLSESVRREDKKSVVTGKINEIRNDLQSYLNDDEGWDKFEENFNVVYDDFMKKLTEKYTNLKTRDRKLCAYLRMGLSSKEMASLLNMSVRSIETARYRLRKKLNLESGENLTDFIQNFNKNLQTKQSDKHEE